ALALLAGDDDEQARRMILDAYPTLQGVDVSQWPTLLTQKIDGDLVAGTMTGTIVGAIVCLIFFGFIGLAQTMVAGRLRREAAVVSGLISYACFTISLICLLFLVGSNVTSAALVGSGYIDRWLVPAVFIAAALVAIVAVQRRWWVPVQVVTAMISLVTFEWFIYEHWYSEPAPAVAVVLANVDKAQDRIATTDHPRRDFLSLARSHAAHAGLMRDVGKPHLALQPAQRALQAVNEAAEHPPVGPFATSDDEVAESRRSISTLLALSASSGGQRESIESSLVGLRLADVSDNSVRKTFVRALGVHDYPDQIVDLTLQMDVSTYESLQNVRDLFAEAGRGRSESAGAHTGDWLRRLASQYADANEAFTIKQRETFVLWVTGQQSFRLYGPYATPPEAWVQQQLDQTFDVEEALPIGANHFQGSPVLQTDQAIGDYVDLVQNVAERDRAVAYAHTILTLQQAQTVRFRLASDDAAKVWIDADVVFENAKARQLSQNQRTFDVQLAAGRHEMLLKITQSTGKWGFQIDATDSDDFPLAIWNEQR
ncbi:MAG: hypothetical protein HKN47_26515, partial [Pirellulaceae bacterium]|nr:hypothetical protein [Pirellulaceae bacterium]